MTTQKQIKANRENAKKSTGPKSEEGRMVASKNAEVHGILANVFSGEDEKFIEQTKEKFDDDPPGAFRKLLLDRLAIWILRLERAKVFEREFLMEQIDPPKPAVIKPLFDIEEEIIEEAYEGTPATIKPEAIEQLVNTVLRYEKAAENRLFKVVNVLNELDLF